MIPKVSSLWRMGAMTLIGMVLGIMVAIKYIAPPSQDIKIGHITIKAKKGSTINDGLDITKMDSQEVVEDNSETKEKHKERKLFKRRNKQGK